MPAPATSTEAPTASTPPELAAQLQHGAFAAATAPATLARLADLGCGWHAGTWRIFPGTRDQVAEVRRYISTQLAGHPALDDATLAASELATNAITHTASGQPGGVFAIHLTHASPDHIALLVTDQGGPEQPQITQPGIDQETGRGLQVVQAIASLLITTGDTTGRHVLAAIPAPPQAAPAPGTMHRRKSMTPDTPAQPASAPESSEQEAALQDAEDFLVRTAEAVHPDLASRTMMRYLTQYRAHLHARSRHHPPPARPNPRPTRLTIGAPSKSDRLAVRTFFT